jgi:CoA-transferase family III
VIPDLQERLIAQAWAALSADDPGTRSAPPAPVTLTGTSGHLASRFVVEEVAVASVAVALLAAGAFSEQRGRRPRHVHLDRAHVADAVRSERYFRVAGHPAGGTFAPLSRFWPAADGWVRTHANYAWHRTALVKTLGTSEAVDSVAAAIAELSAETVEQRVIAAGGIATAVRTLDAWRVHPQGQAVAAEPLIGHRMLGDSAPRPRVPTDLPMTGVRVLDFTRVIAGPVCTRFLGALGADVLRLDPPGHPDMPTGAAADTLLGKRSAFLDWNAPESDARLHELLAHADVVVCGYRPGALDRFGLDAESLAQRHPGIVAVFLDAWGHTGPWADRRGFDSVVQAPTGIAAGESLTGDEPGALPCQLLDHGTGYLAAAAVIDGLHRQASRGGTHLRRLSLARTAWWLTSQDSRPEQRSGTTPAESAAPAWQVELESPNGPVTAVLPPGGLDDVALRWPLPVTTYGADPATTRPWGS